MENKLKWRWGVNRWFVFLCMALAIVGASIFPAISPHIQVAPEALTEYPIFTLPIIGAFIPTNTLVAMIFVDAILIAMALLVRSATRSGELVPKGVSGAIEWLMEMLYNLTESTAGKWAKTIFPYFATITLMVLFANWLELIPGVDSIGILHKSEHGYPLLPITDWLAAIVQGEAAEGQGYHIIPYVRVPSTDLNFTVALAIVSVVMTQVIGLKAQGPRYLTKFFNVTTLFKKPGFGLMDLLISILELISELSKLLSFSFRLFGNIFAGSVLLFLVGSILPAGASWMQSGILLFEFFIGLIQAIVFGMLTMVFMSMATHGHGDEEHAD
ncbi:MAG: ATP synthase F0 subunit A [Anaerolinea sp.]|nr:ATP synthase F0 subunit A [Anaerolinea sp.]